MPAYRNAVQDGRPPSRGRVAINSSYRHSVSNWSVVLRMQLCKMSYVSDVDQWERMMP